MVKAKKESLLLNQDKILNLLFYLLIILIPTQFGKHYWPDFSFVSGLRLDYLSPTLYLTDLIILLILLFSAKNIFKNIILIRKKTKILIIVFLLLLIINITFSQSPLAGVYGLVKIIEYFLLTIFIVFNLKKLSKNSIFISLAFALLFQSTLAILQVFNQGSLGGIFYYLGERTFTSSTPGIANASINGELILRPYATFSHPNVLAGFIIIYLLLALNVLRNNNKLFYIFTILLSTVALLLTLSRIAIALWFFYLLIIFGITMYKKYKNTKLNVNKHNTVIVISIFLSTILINGQTVYQRFLTTSFLEESFIQRQELILKSFDLINKNPMLGVGVNNFYYELINTSIVQPVHNIFLLAFSQVGILLGILFIYVFIKAINISLKKENLYLFLAALCIIVIGSFDHYFLTLQQGQLMMTLVLGLIFAKTSPKH